MSKDIAVREPQTVALSNDQLRYISTTEFVPKSLRGNLPAIMACVVTGREVGIGDMAALRTIHIIDGRPTFSAELMVLLVRRRGHSIQGSVTDGSATATGKRADTGDEMTATWTLDMAKRAGLLSKGNWQKYPEAMLWARAVSQLCRMLFADVFAGGTYTPDELGDDALADVVVEVERSAEAADAHTPHVSAAEPPRVWEEPLAFYNAAEADATPIISEAQLTRLHTIATNRGVPKDEAKRLVKEWGGVDSSKLLPRDRYDAVCAALEAWRAPAESFADLVPEGAMEAS